MINPTKISQFQELSVDVNNPPSYTYFPIIFRDNNGTLNNGKTSLSSIINGLKNVIVSVAQQAISTGEYQEPTSPGSGGGDSSLANRVTQLENAINNITQASNYPVHKIIINNGSEDVATYDIPTGPGGASQTIRIISNSATRPKYLLELTISTINVTGSTLTVGVSVVASTQGTYEGGTISNIQASGSYSGGSTSGSLNAVVLSSSTTNITNSNSLEVTGTLYGSIPAGTDQVQATVQLRINGQDRVVLTAIGSKYGNTTNAGKASTLIS